MKGVFQAIGVALAVCWVADAYEAAGTTAESLTEDVWTAYRQYKGSCWRYLDADGVYGCSTGMDGRTGIAFRAVTVNDTEKALESAPFGSYALVVDEHIVMSNGQRDLMQKLVESDNIASLFIVPSESRSVGWSPAAKCPNCRYGLYAGDKDKETYDWNLEGNNMLAIGINKALHYLFDDAQREDIVECALSNMAVDESTGAFELNTKWPKCGLKTESFMHAAGNSDICLRRGLCDTIQGVNIYKTLKDVNIPAPAPKMAIVTASIGSDALFPGMATGANSVASGAVVVMAVAAALGNVDVEYYDKNVLFALLDGEQRGYVGSTNLAEGIMSSEFRDKFGDGLDADKIDKIISINGIGLNGEKVYLHYERDQPGSVTEADSLLLEMGGYSGIDVLHANNTKSGLPPGTSAQAFLLHNRSIPSLAIADHSEKGFVNPFYHSIFDDARNLNDQSVDKMVVVANALANYMYKYAKTDTAPELNIKCNRTHMVDLLGLFTVSVNNSTLFQTANKGVFYDIGTSKMLDAPLGTYLSVTGTAWDTNPGGFFYSPPKKATALASIWATMTTRDTDVVEADNATCLDNDFIYTMLTRSKSSFWIEGEQRCVNTTIFASVASSPGFKGLGDGGFGRTTNNGQYLDTKYYGYPQVTESNWDYIQITRVGVVPAGDDISVLSMVLVSLPITVLVIVLSRWVFNAIEKEQEESMKQKTQTDMSEPITGH